MLEVQGTPVCVALVDETGRARLEILGTMTVLAYVFVPVPALVEANSRRGEHWSVKKRRKDVRISATLGHLRLLGHAECERLQEIASEEPILVRMTAISVQEPNDDNLAGALKHYRDAVAHWLGIPDEEPRVKYVPKWERYRGKGARGVRIEFVRFIDHLREEQARIAEQIATLTGAK